MISIKNIFHLTLQSLSLILLDNTKILIVTITTKNLISTIKSLAFVGLTYCIANIIKRLLLLLFLSFFFIQIKIFIQLLKKFLTRTVETFNLCILPN